MPGGFDSYLFRQLTAESIPVRKPCFPVAQQALGVYVPRRACNPRPQNQRSKDAALIRVVHWAIAPPRCPERYRLNASEIFIASVILTVSDRVKPPSVVRRGVIIGI